MMIQKTLERLIECNKSGWINWALFGALIVLCVQLLLIGTYEVLPLLVLCFAMCFLNFVAAFNSTWDWKVKRK